MDEDCKPNLGCATTRELLSELYARGQVSSIIGEFPVHMAHLETYSRTFLNLLPDEVLDYRTVDS